MNKQKALPLAAIFLVLVGCSKPPIPQEQKVPEISLVDLKTGSSKKLSSFLGKTIVLDFWATWCPPCMQAIPDLSKLSKDFASKDVVIIGISSEKKDVVKHAIERAKPSYAIYLDPDDASNAAFKLQAMPTVVIIDRQGQVVYNEEGPTIEIVRSELQKVLQK